MQIRWKRTQTAFLIFLYFLLPAALAGAAEPFPEAFFPSGAHPRLWLGEERLSALADGRRLQTERWRSFQTLCDSLIDTGAGNDPWNLAHSPQNYTAPLALMYRLTGDSRYADRAMALMDAVSLDFTRYGNPDHESWHYLGLTYDWLQDHAGMTEDAKTRYREMIAAVSDKFWEEDNLSASGTDSDQNLLTAMIHLTLGAALYGDHPGAGTMLDRGWKGWTEGYFHTSGTSNRDLVKAALGGVYFTGMAYFPSTDITGISGFQMTLESACNYNLKEQEPNLSPFWANILLSMIHLTEPSREKIYPNGAWQDPNRLADQPWLRRAMTIAAHFAEQAGYPEAAALGRGYAREVDIGYGSDPFTELLFDLPEAAATSPYLGGNMPLVRFADNPDFLLFRDNWGTSATWGMFGADGSIPFDHQAPDHGHFSLWRDNTYLTRGARSYDAISHGEFFNTLSIENGCTVNGNPCPGTAIFNSEKPASISRHRKQEAAPLFAYAMMEADGQWNDPPTAYQPLANVASYRRHFFWAGDHAVVMDRLRTEEPGWSRYRLRAETEPVVTGATVSQLSADGKQRLIQRTLEPSGAAPEKIDESMLWNGVADWIVNASERNWQTVIELPVSTSTNVLNVIQMGPASMAAMDTVEHLSGNGRTGARIGDWVVTFAGEESLMDGATYTVGSGGEPLHHLVADLTPGYYDILENGEAAGSVLVLESDNTALFQSNSSASPLEIRLVPGHGPDPALPVAGIRVNNTEGEISVSRGTPLSLAVRFHSGDREGLVSDWWIAASTPSGWQSLVVSETGPAWAPELNRCALSPLASFDWTELPPPDLPLGESTLYFAVDDNADGIPNPAWWDLIKVNIQ